MIENIPQNIIQQPQIREENLSEAKDEEFSLINKCMYKGTNKAKTILLIDNKNFHSS